MDIGASGDRVCGLWMRALHVADIGQWLFHVKASASRCQHVCGCLGATIVQVLGAEHHWLW